MEIWDSQESWDWSISENNWSMSYSFAQILLSLFISSYSSFTWWHSSSNTAHLLQEPFAIPSLKKRHQALCDLESSIYHRQIWLARGVGDSCFSDPCVYMGLSFRACQHHIWGILFWYAYRTGAKRISLLFLTSHWVCCCSPMVREEPLLLTLPAQTALQTALPHSLMCHMPVCHAPGCWQPLESFKSPSVAPGTAPSSPGCLPRASR